jgi:hypothetical protein
VASWTYGDQVLFSTLYEQDLVLQSIVCRFEVLELCFVGLVYDVAGDLDEGLHGQSPLQRFER